MGGVPLTLAVCVLGIYVTSLSRCTADNPSVQQWLQNVDVDVRKEARNMTLDEWAFFTNVTNTTRAVAEKSKQAFGDYVTHVAEQASSKTVDNNDVNISTQLTLWQSLADQNSTANEQKASLELQLLQKFSEVLDKWNNASGFSDDFNTLLDQWRSMHDDFSKRNLRVVYEQYINVTPPDQGQNSTDIDDMVSKLMALYHQLHDYVRNEMQNSFGIHRMPASGHIPVHLVDGADGMSWYRLSNTVLPYKFAQNNFLSPQDKVLTVEQMLKLGEEFYQTLGFQKLPDSFWKQSQYTDTSAVKVCHPSQVWNFQDQQDYRISGCLDVSQGKLLSAVDLVGRVVSQRAQSILPFILQHNALADTDYVTAAVSGALSLAFVTPAHLRQIGLMNSSTGNPEEDEINFLMEVALDQLPPLAWYHVISQWQMTHIAETPSQEWNSKWWKLRCTVEGVSPPVSRSEADFDLVSNVDALLNRDGDRLFQTTVARFQILKALCETAGHTGNLSACSLRNSSAVGDKIRSVDSQGRLLSPKDKLQRLTGSDRLDASAMTDFFKPLTTWLTTERPALTDTLWAAACPDPDTGKVRDSEAVEAFLETYDKKSKKNKGKYETLTWNYETNITDYNQELMVNYSTELSEFSKEYARQSAMFDLDHLANATQRRLLKMIGDIGTAALKDENKVARFHEIVARMAEIYSTAQVCFTEDNCIPLDPDVKRLFEKSRNYTLLAEAWELWRKATGGEMKDLYEEYVQLGNEGVQELGFNDMGEYWRDPYEDENLQEDLAALMEQLRPLYEKLHTYVRKRLKGVYGEDNFPETGHIPAHILGDVLAQMWDGIYDLLTPYPGRKSVDVTDEMIKQNWTAPRMFHTSDEFYTSLGLGAMPQPFWDFSMLERPTDGRQIVCHPSAWNFYNGQDFRIKMCTEVVMRDLITVHHEMGHIQYFLEYKDLPVNFQEAANPGFHEAIGDTMALSAVTPQHLQKIGLLPSAPDDKETDINFLLKMALEKVAFLPFAYLIDLWRWSVFSGATPPHRYNPEWWRLRCQLQGVSPPVDRSLEDFDPGAKFHVASDVPFMRYFISYVLQFTLFQRLCEAANHTGPLHRCDFYQSKEAGNILRDLLQKGASQPWQDVLQAFNGQRSINASAILLYFQPLADWLDEQNAGETPGWSDHCPPGTTEKIRDENLARSWLQQYDQEYKDIVSKSTVMSWNYATNVTDENQQKQVESDLQVAQWNQRKAAEVDRYDWEHFSDSSLVRQFRFAANIGTSAMKNETKLKELTELQSTLEGIYAKAKVKDPKTGAILNLDPELTELMASSRDYDELLMAWKEWRDVTGPLMKSDYEKFVELSNEAVRTLGFKDTAELWRTPYESDTFQADVEALLKKLTPLYTQLHAFVRRKLVEKYGADKFPYSGHIPAHLLGNMWAQAWDNLFEFLQPFPNKSAIDVSKELLRQDYTVTEMFTTAEEFFTSLGLKPMPRSFWTDSMLERPQDGRDVVCHASAWDFRNGKDFRIKMCTVINMESLITIHHEMGHIQYYLQYKNQPSLFQQGANPGFHEAIGDTLALSVSTPKHLHTIQLVPDVQEDKEADLNYLLNMALKKIAFLPFGYLIDQWRWSVFSGDTTPDHYNDYWWKLRCKFQGISSPIPRNTTDFDPGAKYHVPANTPYIRYFVSHVLQFQFYKALCDAAGHNGSLHTCDFYRSQKAGELLSNMLQLGRSKPWPEALEQITGTRHMDVGPLLEYFRPLQEWLEEQNAGQPIGWSEECPTEELTTAAQWLHDYDQRLEKVREESTFADWNYETNITDETSAVSVQGRVKLGAFQKEEAKKAEQLQWRNLSDFTIRRQFQLLTNIGPSAMEDPADYEKMQSIQSKMQGIYGAGKVCLNSSTDCLGLEPDLEDIMATSRDYDLLLKVWEGWRNVTGRQMKSLYEQFAALSNKGVQPLGYADTGEYWRSFYESPTFQKDLEILLDQLSPLYEQLHAYVRRKLMEVYGEDKFPETGHIPAHLLGNMWAQEWNNIFSIVQPYKNRTAIDVTAAMKQQNYSVKRMFETAEAFFSSLGFEPLPQSFWNDSVMEKPSDRDIVCHASAWDFFNAKDFRIKMCTSVNQEDLVTIHHEMGHIQYYMQYRRQPQTYRDGANPGFHEAVGDTIALSVNTPSHLRKINLLEEGQNNELDDINFLLKMALEKVAFLPFGYLIDQWRWSVFSGDTPPDRYNQDWWNLRCRYQGISPPVPRSAEDFDPGAKYHVPGNTPYIRYFVSFVVQFQFHQALCKAAGYTGPVHHCDIYQSEPAGKALRSMLSKGSSIPWPVVLKELTGDSKLNASALLEYFRPLQRWLEEQNAGERQGWTWTCPTDDQLTRQIQSTAAPTQQPSGGVSQSEGRTTSGEDQGQTRERTPRETVTRDQTTRHAATGDGSSSARQVILGVDLMLICLILSHLLRK